jgi:hypothetical protein
MAFCTIVEWDKDINTELSTLQGDNAPPAGSIVRVFGSSESGTYAIEIWESSDDARRFAELSAPTLAASTLPPPTRGAAFQVAQLFIRERQE